MYRPLIGISCCDSSERAPDISRYPLYHVYAWYCDAIWKAGGRPVMIPPVAGSDSAEEAADMVRRLDGIYFSGGGLSTAPKAAVQPKLMETQPKRSLAECALVRAGKDIKLPMIGSCRGHQIICESLGGTLSEETLPNHSQKTSYYYPTHSVDIEKNSRLAAIVGSGPWMVNSMHCQFVETCPPGFIANAWGPEGTVEGMETTDPDWYCITFQYHPEVLIFDERAKTLMESFVEAARLRASSR
ncbi:MAG: gamma-glutamyl-gamma-aminobutyrate hydrolase family protein [Firmicutes bacterium]|nr:gamma-glutamyl-gamma-aminobutyrate hydrolase family protein [Bacillota bacterium]